jgi:hypothetical protein
MAKIYAGKLALVSDPYLGAGSGPHERWREHVALIVTVNGQPLDSRLDLEELLMMALKVQRGPRRSHKSG